MGRFPTFRIYGPIGHLGVSVRQFIHGQHFGNSMTVRKEVPRLGNQRKNRFGAKCPSGESANAGTRRRNGAESHFGENGSGKKIEGMHRR